MLKRRCLRWLRCSGFDVGSSSVIDDIVGEGARRMLAEALQAEVEACCAQFADVRDENGRRLVVRTATTIHAR
jgi:hypothetical protein